MPDLAPADRRAIEAEIAQKHFGYTASLTPRDANGENGGDEYLIPPTGLPGNVLPPLGRISRNFFVPQWTESWEQAKKLMERLAAEDVEASLSPNDAVHWTVNAFNRRTKLQASEFGTDVPLMICRVFLKIKNESS